MFCFQKIYDWLFISKTMTDDTVGKQTLKTRTWHNKCTQQPSNLYFIFSSWELMPYSHYMEGFTLPNKYLSTVNKNCRPHGILNVASYPNNSITNSTDIIISFFIIFWKSSSVSIDFTFSIYTTIYNFATTIIICNHFI